MKYEVSFDFTVVKRRSNFIGKSGVVEIDTNNPLSEEEIVNLKTDKAFQESISRHLSSTMKQKNIFMVTIKSIKTHLNPTPPCQTNSRTIF